MSLQAICALQNRDRSSDAPPRIGAADGAADARFKRLARNFQSGGPLAEMDGYNH